MATTPREYLTKSLAGASRGQLATAADARASATVLTIPALSVTAVTGEFTPEVTTNASALTSVPAAGTAWNFVGWQGSLTTTDSYYFASAVTIPITLSFTAAAAFALTVTVILYNNNGELGRATVVVNVINGTVTTAGLSIAVAAGVTIGAGDNTVIAVFGAATNSGTGAQPVTLNYGANAFFDSFPARLSAVRNASDGTGAAPVDTASRQGLTVRRAVQQTETYADSAVSLRIVTRTSYQGDGDPPITNGTKRIAGTVYVRSSGARYVTGATVVLIRDRDGREVATTQSQADGTYSFVRDAADPETYTTRIKTAPVGNLTEEAVSQSGLVPA